jgi:hypothetical protein
MLTYLRRGERKPSNGWGRLASLFRTGSDFVEDNELPLDFAERRLNRRVLAYWESKRTQTALPALRDISGAELGLDWPHCFVLDIRRDYGFTKFDFLGTELAKFSGIFLSGRTDWKCTVLDKATNQVGKVLATRGPVLCDDELTLFDGRRLLFRSVLLPLGSSAITHIFGAANGRLIDGPLLGRLDAAP